MVGDLNRRRFADPLATTTIAAYVLVASGLAARRVDVGHRVTRLIGCAIVLFLIQVALGAALVRTLVIGANCPRTPRRHPLPP